MTTTTASFTFDRWDAEVLHDADGISISRTSMAKTFTGQLTGTSVGELVMAQAPAESAAYGGFERVTAQIGDASGSFVLRHSAVMSSTGGSMDLVVMADTGTGAFAGITGDATISRHDDGSHTFTLSWTLPTP